MLTNTNKKVICIKDIPSNLIEEAFFILRTNDTEEKNMKTKEMKRKIVLQETNDLLHTYIFDIEKEKRKKEEQNAKRRKVKKCLGMILLGLFCLFVSIIILV